ncbi:MAG: hypothetical protein K6E86_08675 [Bacteroidales bacterium]|nr:hypothetical protein [Bacteroidales bacterium]
MNAKDMHHHTILLFFVAPNIKNTLSLHQTKTNKYNSYENYTSHIGMSKADFKIEGK